jgi:hypothetical protein
MISTSRGHSFTRAPEHLPTRLTEYNYRSVSRLSSLQEGGLPYYNSTHRLTPTRSILASMENKDPGSFSRPRVVLFLVLLLGVSLKCELLPLDQNSHKGLHFQGESHQLLGNSYKAISTLTPMVKLQHETSKYS